MADQLGHAPRRAAVAALAPALGLLLLLGAAKAQLPNPLTGQDGDSLPSPSPVGVRVDALLERIVQFDFRNSQYEAIWWVILTWRDAGAADAVAARTGPLLAGEEGAAGCERPCDASGMLSYGCCDTLWLPHVEMPNMLLLPSDQPVRYRIAANASSGGVTWSTRIVGTWYTPLDFRAYPFDHQHLTLQLALGDGQAAAAGLTWGTVAPLTRMAHTKGPDLSGWLLKWTEGKLYDSRMCFEERGVATLLYGPPGTATQQQRRRQQQQQQQRQRRRLSADGAAGPSPPPSAPSASASSASASAVTLPLPLAGRHLPQPAGGSGPLGECAGDGLPYYAEAGALYGPVVLVADVMIKREIKFYVLTTLLPVLIIGIVVLIAHCMPPDALGERMGVVLTMFLALTAMQFLFDFPPANYLNALQLVVLVTYVLMAVTVLESLLVNRLVSAHVWVSYKRTARRRSQALDSRPRRGPATRGNRVTTACGGDNGDDGGGGAAEGLAALHDDTAHLARHRDLLDGDPTDDDGGGARPDGGGGGGKETAADGGAAPLLAAPSEPSDEPAARGMVSVHVCSGGGGGVASLPPSGASSTCTAAPFPAAAAAVDCKPAPQQPLPFAALSLAAPAPAPRSTIATTSSTSAVPAAASIGRPRRPAPACGRAWRALRRGCAAAWAAPRAFRSRLREDPEYAAIVAGRIDTWCGIGCLWGYGIAVAVVVSVQTLVGDHKLMLGSAPGNM